VVRPARTVAGCRQPRGWVFDYEHRPLRQDAIANKSHDDHYKHAKLLQERVKQRLKVFAALTVLALIGLLIPWFLTPRWPILPGWTLTPQVVVHAACHGWCRRPGLRRPTTGWQAVDHPGYHAHRGHPADQQSGA
jgi:hypothetical protein